MSPVRSKKRGSTWTSSAFVILILQSVRRKGGREGAPTCQRTIIHERAVWLEAGAWLKDARRNTEHKKEDCWRTTGRSGWLLPHRVQRRL